MYGTTEVEKYNESDDRNQQQANEKTKYIANIIRQFTTEILSSIDNTTSVSNAVNDYEENYVVFVEKH